ncbi:MAG TPA: AbrB/MazE/SpoVT family DNA-binding domain-containing protein [Candidatus Limnocylindria bacterium]|jgi:AbrB family looped-hinge helix DNA binding protein
MLSVKVSSKHQVAVPSAARRALGIRAGDRLTVVIRENEVALVPRHPSAVERLRGSGGGYWGDDPVAYIRALRDEWD